MKTKRKFVTYLLSALSLTALASWPLRAPAAGTATTATLSAPDQPATLRIDLPWADIHLAGVDGSTVTVSSTLKPQGAKDARSDGLRRLDDEANFNLSEHDNLVSLTIPGDDPAIGGNNAAFNISVPRAMALDIKTTLGGDLQIKNVSGDIEINNTNGLVDLEGITGSAIVNTVNGDVHASYAQAPRKPISLTSMNGEITLQVPGDTRADVQLRTRNGSILTDFDEAKLRTKSEKKTFAAPPVPSPTSVVAPPPQVPRPPSPPPIGGKLVSGTLNGGGTDIAISTMSGAITLRQAEKVTTDSKTKGNVTVAFQNPDSFTDAGDNGSSLASTETLDELRDYVQDTVAPRLAAGMKLTVTFLDLDLAGMIRPDKNNIRIMTAITMPRAHLKFQLVGADGQVIQEGERRLADVNYQQSISLPGRNDPLGYDKQLLKDWIVREFKPKP